MKHEAAGASLQSVKFRSCLSSRQGDINLKCMFIIAEGGEKGPLEFYSFFKGITAMNTVFCYLSVLLTLRLSWKSIGCKKKMIYGDILRLLCTK